MKEIRWKQRFENLKAAHNQLTDAVNLEEYSILERAGLIQMFEFTFELSWKTLKDFLEAERYEVTSPKEVIRQAFQAGYIDDGGLWLEALDSRNFLSHSYDEKRALEAEELIANNYFPMITQLVSFLETKL